jgi:hypothetical protein
MNREFPDDVLGLIKEFAKPIWTRKDWRTCGYRESTVMMRYHEWQYLLYYDIDWYRLVESGMYLFNDAQEIVDWIQREKIVRRLIQYEHRYYRNIMHLVSMKDILRDWMFEHLPWALIAL